jgi:hypothetical protein
LEKPTGLGDPLMRAVLQKIAEILNAESFPWLLAGKTAAVLQGAIIHSNNLIILTDMNGANFFGEKFATSKNQRIKYREDPPFAAFSGIFQIDDIEIHLYGDPEILHEHRKFKIPVDDIFLETELVEIGLERVPIISLEWILTLAIFEQDQPLINAIIPCEISRETLNGIIETLGANYYLRPLVEKILK